MEGTHGRPCFAPAGRQPFMLTAGDDWHERVPAPPLWSGERPGRLQRADTTKERWSASPLRADEA